MHVPIPLLMAVELLQHGDDDVMSHHLRVGVVGADGPLTVDIESDFYWWPRIKQVHDYAGVYLPARLQNLWIFKCFDLLADCLDGTDIAQFLLPDATEWIEVQFLTDEAEMLLAELRKQVIPGLVIDPARISAFTPVILPKGEKHA